MAASVAWETLIHLVTRLTPAGHKREGSENEIDKLVKSTLVFV